jgi:hypothetical protein
MEQPPSRKAITTLEGWLMFLAVIVLCAGAIAGYAGAYAWLGSDTSHGARIGVSVVAGIVGGLALATPYLVVMAVLALLRDIADRAT